MLGGTCWGCCRFGFEGDVDGWVSGKSWLLLLLLLLDVDVACVCVCVLKVQWPRALRDRSDWIRSGFARGMGVKVGGMNGTVIHMLRLV